MIYKLALQLAPVLTDFVSFLHPQVKLPAEQEDWLKRPAYIRENDAGVPICENRYSFAVTRSNTALIAILYRTGYSIWWQRAPFCGKGALDFI